MFEEAKPFLSSWILKAALPFNGKWLNEGNMVWW